MVSEVMHKGVTTVQISDSIRKVAAVMKREDIGSVPVYKNERPVGFVTDRDIVISSIAQGHSIDDSISLAMHSDIISIRETADISLAANLMRENQISRLLVVDEGNRPTGILSLHDLAEYVDDETLSAKTFKEIKRS